MGISNSKEAAILDGSTLYGQSLYLRLIQWNLTPGSWTPQDPTNEDGSLATNMSEVATGGYAAVSVASTDWDSAVVGAPTKKQFPKASGGRTVTFTPSEGVTWYVCGYVWTTNSSAITSSNTVSSGVMLDVNGNPALKTVDPGHPLTINGAFPIVERLGDPPIGVDPT